MAFLVDPVEEGTCPHCRQTVDVRAATPLSQIPCPHCDMPMTVPVKMGSVLIKQLIGEGTGSRVYEAEDRVLGRKVALKVMKEIDEDMAGKQDGIDEARALLLIDHPNVVKVYAIDTRRGQPCIIMEILPGGSLKDRIKDGGIVSEADTLQMAIDVCHGLEETSNRGLLHLDVKPGNVMFDEKGTAKLLDFGFSAVDPDDELKEILGTPYYVSPELVRQRSPDTRADMYSLGATMFHVMTGEAPFEDRTIKKILLARLNAPAPDIRAVKPQISEKTGRILRRLMAEDPDIRYQSYKELVRELTDALGSLRPAASS